MLLHTATGWEDLLSKTIRLPNVEEWEYAARGGVNGGDDKFYSGSNILEDVSWCKFNSNERTQPVGLKKSNELGIYDMSGNVYEFCGGIERQYDSTKRWLMGK